MSLFTELKRRHVFKVGAAYLVVGWVLIQAADIVAPQLALPDWAPRLITFLVLLGFPIAMVLAWIFDLTPEGVQVTEGQAGGKRFFVIIGVILAVSLGWFFYDRNDSADEIMMDTAQVSPSIAVLPFIDLSQGKDQGYFADGIAEEILNLLARNPDLRVVARTSAFQFRDAADLRAVGAALSANRILEGSVRTSGNRIRITAQLIDTHSGLHLWSETYDRELTDIFVLQDEIAAAITQALGAHLGVPAATARVVQVDADAYDLYLRGRKGLNERGTPGRLAEAIELLQHAVARDTALAVAHGTLALAHVLSPWYMDVSSVDALTRTLASADHALALEPGNVEALVAKGYGLAFIGLRIAEGERLLQRALELRPNDFMAHNLMGDIGRMLDDHDIALRHEGRAAELDPLDSVAQSDLAWVYFAKGDFQQATVHARRGLSLEPRNPFAVTALVRSLAFSGNLAAAKSVYDQALADRVLARDDPQYVIAGMELATIAGDEPAMAAFRLAIDESGDRHGLRIFVAYLEGDTQSVAELFTEALSSGRADWVRYGVGADIYGALIRARYSIPAPPAYLEYFQRHSQASQTRWDLRTRLLELRDRQVVR